MREHMLYISWNQQSNGDQTLLLARIKSPFVVIIQAYYILYRHTRIKIAKRREATTNMKPNSEAGEKHVACRIIGMLV